MRIFLLFLLAFFAYLRPITAQTRNISKGTGIAYTNGAPSYTVRTAYDGENAVDITTGQRWFWNRSTSAWVSDHERVMLLAGTSAPAFTPGYGQPKLVLNDANVLYRNVSGSTWATVGGGGGGGGTVTSVGLTMPSIMNVTGSPVTTSGTIGVTLAAQSPRTFLAGAVAGGSTTPFFRAIVDTDLPTIPISKIAAGTSNQLLGTNAAGTGLEHKSLVAGSGITIAYAGSSVTFAAQPPYSGTANQTLRHDGSAFVASSNLLNTGTTVETPNTLKAGHLGYMGSAPTIALGTGAGTGATATVTGGDNAFLVSITTGTTPAAGPADVFTITFATAYTATPTIVFIPDNQNASIADGRLFFFSKSNSGFTIRNRTTALTASVTYTYAVMVIGN